MKVESHFILYSDTRTHHMVHLINCPTQYMYSGLRLMLTAVVLIGGVVTIDVCITAPRQRDTCAVITLELGCTARATTTTNQCLSNLTVHNVCICIHGCCGYPLGQISSLPSPQSSTSSQRQLSRTHNPFSQRN